MRALPMPPRKVTELVPLPAQPPHVKVPDVEKVTGSAFASDVPSATIARSNALIRVALKTVDMSAPFAVASIALPHLPSPEGTPSHGLWHWLRLMTLTAAGQTQPLKPHSFSDNREQFERQAVSRYFFRNRLRTLAAAPSRPVPNSSILAGSGTVSVTSPPPSRTCRTSSKVAPLIAVRLMDVINCPLMAVTVKKFSPFASTVKSSSKKPPVMLTPSTWIRTDPLVAAFMLNTARVKVSLFARPNVNWVRAVFPVPPLTVAWPDGLALSNPLPLSELKLTKRSFWPTVPVTVSTLVAGFSRTLSVP